MLAVAVAAAGLLAFADLDTLSTVFTTPAWVLSGPDADGRYTAKLTQDLAGPVDLYDDLGKVCVNLDVFSITGMVGKVGVKVNKSTAHNLGKSDLRFVGTEQARIVGGAGSAIAGLDCSVAQKMANLEIGVSVVGGKATGSSSGGVGIKGPTSSSYAFRLSIRRMVASLAATARVLVRAAQARAATSTRRWAYGVPAVVARVSPTASPANLSSTAQAAAVAPT